MPLPKVGTRFVQNYPGISREYNLGDNGDKGTLVHVDTSSIYVLMDGHTIRSGGWNHETWGTYFVPLKKPTIII